MRYHTQFCSNDPLLTLKTQHPTHSLISTRRPSISSLSSNRPQSVCANTFYSNQAEITSRLALSRKRSRDDCEGLHHSATTFPYQPVPRYEPHQQIGKKSHQAEFERAYAPNRSVPLAGPLYGRQRARTNTKLTSTLALEKMCSTESNAPISKIRKIDTASLLEPNGPIFQTSGIPENREGSIIDSFTRHLGIGWSSLSDTDPETQAATRGWIKFIENHFPLSNVRIQLRSKGLASYLIESNEGYFLFGEDLKQGRLVSVNLEKTWINLQGACPIFEGQTIMEAAQSPSTITQPNLGHGEFSTFQSPKASTSIDLKLLGTDNSQLLPVLEVGMDLS
ncbi:BgTH12-03106 [Blumeria graminis f. sp. triticale]|uniref:BgTH12-03106 n=1 Tax=Blumeria graminis f. sp. triticale TaxID=1689686 RepID=A0A9W4D3Z2_BLUGR|nr:BgTH12-03106 [Blumeria graminis f. sp. triticale]